MASCSDDYTAMLAQKDVLLQTLEAIEQELRTTAKETVRIRNLTVQEEVEIELLKVSRSFQRALEQAKQAEKIAKRNVS